MGMAEQFEASQARPELGAKFIAKTEEINRIAQSATAAIDRVGGKKASEVEYPPPVCDGMRLRALEEDPPLPT
jgi:hypothetical protein